MSEALYLRDCNIKEFKAKVIAVEGNKVELDKTAFYPKSGGVANDTGFLISKDKKYEVIDVYKQDGRIIHVLSNEGLTVGEEVQGVINWDRRRMLVRMHTAAHLLSALFYNKLGAKITGNQIDVDKSRIDFSLESFDRALIEAMVEEANKIIEKGAEVKIYFMKREEALKIPGLIKLAEAQPPNVDVLRIVEIEGIDIQADGGCHVSNIKEIGRIVLLKMENKGKTNRRIYYKVE